MAPFSLSAPRGQVRQQWYHSKAIGAWRRVYVCTPSDYDTNREFADSGLLMRAMTKAGMEYSMESRTAIGGWGAANTNVFNIENRRVIDYNRPNDGTACAGERSFDETTNPSGVRCTFQDFMASILGRRSEDKAPIVFDNVGVQYGLQAQISDLTVEPVA